ncbi:hypothetical protein D5H75_23480 [Bailinhaonella thermotolerans]|uniref:ABC-2 type transport system permease protein n=2 Tax=Bailinhaonella thermotolerans TaxID=1070861 RepID=A0A3A4B8R3_9ACTN|nr:hypothetical protein D5H75_23480 [Bailinhaonella thermotolerans]
MKLAVMRHSSTDERQIWMTSGATAGLVAAGLTIWFATYDISRPAALMDLLAAVFAMWAFGWIAAPVWGGQAPLRAEHFAHHPVPRVRLAAGLLAASLVGIGAGVTVVGFGALIVFGARLGIVPALVAVPALVLQLALVVLLSRLAARLFGALSRSRTGAAITGVLTAVLLVASQAGWIVFIAVEAVLATGFSPGVSAVLRALPSSWGLVAVEAAARSDWAVVAAALLGLAVGLVLLTLLWGRLLGPGRLARSVVRGSDRSRRIPSRPVTAVYLKELRTWRRDPLRVQGLVVAPVFAVLTGLVPLAFGSTAFLPYAGVLAALLGAVGSANLYGQDGTALWLTLLRPGTERADVRGRQLGWLTVFGPLSLGLTVVGGLWHGDPDAWPWALASVTAALGAGAGLVPLLAVDQLVPGPDPHRNRDSPLDHGDVTGLSFVMLFLAITAASPALAVVAAGEAMDSPALRWTGVAAGVGLGAVCAWAFGARAARRLRERGPELLYLMRSGKPVTPPEEETEQAAAPIPAARQAILWTLFFVGVIALFPQGLVPLVMKLSGEIARVWFLALHLPDPWQWPTVIAMILLGLTSLTLCVHLYRRSTARPRPPATP